MLFNWLNGSGAALFARQGVASNAQQVKVHDFGAKRDPP
jgi:hypothetical protein